MKTPLHIVIVLGALGLFVAVGWLAWSVLRPYRSVKTWPEIAPRLGLVYTPFPVSTAMQPGSMTGTYAGFAVSIAAQSHLRRGTAMVVEVRFPRPLGLGLCLGTNRELRSAAGCEAPEFGTDDQEFDKTFQPRARDGEGARAVFARDALRAALLELVKWDRNVGVDDDKITYILEDMVADFDPVREILDRVTRAAQLIADGRR